MYLTEIGIHMPDDEAYMLLVGAVLTLNPENMETVKDITVSEFITAAYILTKEGKVYAPMFPEGKVN